MTRAYAIAFGLAVAAALSAAAYDRWHVAVIDGDTLEIGWTRYRIQGLAAPERYEPGGPEATAALQALVDSGGLDCEPTGATTRAREEAVCTVDGEDVAAAMIAAGLGRDCARYSGGRYAALETAAGRELPLPGYCSP